MRTVNAVHSHISLLRARLKKKQVLEFTSSRIWLFSMASATTETTAQLQCIQQGGPFKIVHVPKPALAPDQVLIRQHVIALNLVDTKQRDLGIMIPRWPHVLGIEGAGIIEAVGSDVSDLRPGDEVLAWEGNVTNEGSWGGAFQDRVAVPAYLVARKPRNIGLEEAASLP